MNRGDAFDVITDPDLAGRTADLRRKLAMRLAAQRAFDSWYSIADPAELARRVADPKPDQDPSNILMTTILEFSSSIDARMLDVLRDVGVGAPTLGIPGIGNPTPEKAEEAPKKRGLFR